MNTVGGGRERKRGGDTGGSLAQRKGIQGGEG